MGAVPATAASSLHLGGGGTATISQVAFNVTIDGSGAASGTFNCLMAGRSAFVLSGFGLHHLMKVQAKPSAGSVEGSMVRFSGPGLLIMDGSTPQPIHVRVWADVATQSFQLTVGEVGMPVETMASGGFELH
ncbi:MAG: hypothetical protein E6I92_00030 [Chloroflexi bacterium]|nr:MAG: hypothetical protein E6I92_00030 [Chloroflexota bacterium]